MGLTTTLVNCLAVSAVATGVVATTGDFVSGNCPLGGPDFPQPSGLANSSLIKAAIAAFPSILANGSYGLASTSNCSFAASVFSIADNKTLYSIYNTADSVKNASTGVNKVDGSSVFRLGSISKLLSVYAILMEIGDTYWAEPITKYIPELSKAAADYYPETAIDHVSWSDVTLGELASQSAGVSRDATLLDLADLLPPGTGPKLPSSMVPACGATPTQPPCSRSQFFSYFVQQHPSYPNSGSSPAYSNVAFALLAYAYEAITNSTFESAMDKLFDKAGLENASFDSADAKTGVIPFGNESTSFWNIPVGNEAAAGGYFGSNNDLISLGQSILQNSVIPAAMTRRWMKPHSLLPDMTKAVGMPWEIRRIQDSNNRVTDYYTKEGELGSYSSMLVLSKDHGIGIAVNTADDAPTTPAVLHTLANALVGTFMPAVEETARQQATAKYSGKYSDPATNSSVEISSDDKVGLKLSTLRIGGMDVVGKIYGPTTTVRLFPTGLMATNQTSTGSGQYVSRVGWKAVYEAFPLAEVQKGAFGENCQSWIVVDAQRYGLAGLDEIEFGMSESGEVQSVQVRALEAVMAKEG